MCGVIFRLVPFIKLKLHCVKVKKLNVREWRVFAEPVTYVYGVCAILSYTYGMSKNFPSNNCILAM